MAYVTTSEIEERLGGAAYVELTDDSGSGSADLDKVEEARLSAEGEVNSYLGRRHAVPVDLVVHPEVAPVIRGFTLDLIEYRLHGRRPPVPADVVRRHEEALQWLRRLASGEAVLPSVAAVAGNAAQAPAGATVGPERQFTREGLERI